jgi:hypothetical protein
MTTPFPTKRESLYTLLAVVISYLTSNKTRLSIAEEVLEALTALYGSISSAGTYLYLHAKWSDEKVGRTPDVITNLTRVENEIKEMLSGIYEDIPASVWTDTDRNVLRRKRGLKHTISHHTIPIESNTFLRHRMVGPARIAVMCYAAEDSSRASINKLAGANAIQIAMCIVDPDNNDEGNELSSKVKKIAPKSAEECAYREIHMKAIIRLLFEDQYRKCDVYIYARQYDVRHPELAGPWSEVLIITIP